MSNGARREGPAMTGRTVPSGWTRLLRRRELSVVYAIAALCVLIRCSISR